MDAGSARYNDRMLPKFWKHSGCNQRNVVSLTTIVSCVFWFSLPALSGRRWLICLAFPLSVFTGVASGFAINWVLGTFFNVRDKSG